MNIRKLIFAALPGIVMLAAFSTEVGAQLETTQEQAQMNEKIQERERIYGSQLMTEQERNEHRQKIRQATSPEDREQIRAEHHSQMQERAQNQGVTIPEEPPARGIGQGKGRDQGMGSGRGMGRGQGKRGPGNGMGGGGRRQ